MSHMIFAEQENAGLHPPSVKMRQRLQSAPNEKLLKSPMVPKNFGTPLAHGRKVFGTVSNHVLTPAVHPQERKLHKPQENKVKPALPTKVEEYPEIEKFIPYDPLEFERYSLPEDWIHVSSFALPGLAPVTENRCLFEDEMENIELLPNLSPVTIPQPSGHCSELEAFLKTLDELTVELPPETD
ncbi:securin isoform X2 [Nelusetta ayraudi]|uniref:securin isoform X2 n=1 Tax=Nelusetta ayraudi TaxID=303726 RepID=UPI003F6EEA6C